jgi:hypothetical protein
MSTSTMNVARRCGLRLRRDGLGPGEVTHRQLYSEIDAAFRRWQAKQPSSVLRRLRKPEQLI